MARILLALVLLAQYLRLLVLLVLEKLPLQRLALLGDQTVTFGSNTRLKA